MALCIPGHDFVYGKPLSDFMLFDIMSQCPYQEGLLGSYFLGKKNADPTYNFANPDKPLLMIGEPDFSDPRHVVASRNTGYFDTQLPSTTQMTLVTVSALPLTGDSVLLSNYLKVDAGNVTGDTLLNRISNTDGLARTYYYMQQSAVSVASVSRESGVAPGQYIVCGSLNTGASSNIIGAWSMSEAAAPGFSQATLAGRATTSRTMLLGASYSDTEFLAQSKISAALIFNANIGGKQMTTVMNWLRNVVGVQAGIWSAPKS